MLNIFFKKIKVPISNEEKEVETLQTWEVSWVSQCGSDRYPSYNRETEVFIEERVANDFAASLRAAFKLLRHDCNNNVTVTHKSR